MVAKFRVGEIAILIRGTAVPDSVNKEVEITDLFADDYVNRYGIKADHLPPSIEGTNGWQANESQLRKLPPKEQLSSWDVGVWKPDALLSEDLMEKIFAEGTEGKSDDEDIEATMQAAWDEYCNEQTFFMSYMFKSEADWYAYGASLNIVVIDCQREGYKMAVPAFFK